MFVAGDPVGPPEDGLADSIVGTGLRHGPQDVSAAPWFGRDRPPLSTLGCCCEHRRALFGPSGSAKGPASPARKRAPQDASTGRGRLTHPRRPMSATIHSRPRRFGDASPEPAHLLGDRGEEEPRVCEALEVGAVQTAAGLPLGAVWPPLAGDAHDLSGQRRPRSTHDDQTYALLTTRRRVGHRPGRATMPRRPLRPGSGRAITAGELKTGGATDAVWGCGRDQWLGVHRVRDSVRHHRRLAQRPHAGRSSRVGPIVLRRPDRLARRRADRSLRLGRRRSYGRRPAGHLLSRRVLRRAASDVHQPRLRHHPAPEGEQPRRFGPFIHPVATIKRKLSPLGRSRQIIGYARRRGSPTCAACRRRRWRRRSTPAGFG